MLMKCESQFLAVVTDKNSDPIRSDQDIYDVFVEKLETLEPELDETFIKHIKKIQKAQDDKIKKEEVRASISRQPQSMDVSPPPVPKSKKNPPVRPNRGDNINDEYFEHISNSDHESEKEQNEIYKSARGEMEKIIKQKEKLVLQIQKDAQGIKQPKKRTIVRELRKNNPLKGVARVLLKVESLNDKINELEKEHSILQNKIELLERTDKKNNIVLLGLKRNSEDVGIRFICEQIITLIDVDPTDADQ
ncbi:hypothetical protein JTB14_018427 [Gonioctena quinquepunctata]|nr:hypothetical protein JTB14_018427 [Gonioctena quinquepunctata]